MIKLLFLILIPIHAFACVNFISEPEARKAIALDPTARGGCAKDDKCYCFDDIDWETAELVDRTYDDPVFDDNGVQTGTQKKTETILQTNAAKQAAKAVRIQAEQAAAKAEADARAARKSLFITLRDKQTTITATEVQQFLKAAAAELAK